MAHLSFIAILFKVIAFAMKCIKERLAELKTIQDQDLAEGSSSAMSEVDEEERQVKDFLGHMLLSKTDVSLKELAMNTADLLGAGVDTVSGGWSHCSRSS